MAIGPIKTSQLKSRILQLAQTSVYQIKLSPPPSVLSHLRQNGFDYALDGEDIELLCSSAVLPGSGLKTHDIVGDFQGVSEKMAYQRMYDESVDLTFYVDHDYKVINLFDGWLDYISGKGTGQRLSRTNALSYASNYRMNYPNSYKTNMHIVKFEKDVSPDRGIFYDDELFQLTYTLVNAFPKTIVSTPISYEGSQILKYSVSMSIQRYVRYVDKIGSTGQVPLGTTPATTRSDNNRPTNEPILETTLGRSGNTSGRVGNTNGRGTQFVPTDSATGFRPGANDGPLLLPDGSPAYDANGNLRSMF
jgi:hypothetical protein